MARGRSIKRTVLQWLIRVPERVPMSPAQLLLAVPEDHHTDPDDAPEVPVFVIHWNAPDWCLRTVRNLRESKHVRARITVIDNGGLSADAVAQLQGVDIISTGANLGFTGGANAALDVWRTTSSSVVVIACHDIELHEEGLSLLVHAAARPGVGIVGFSATGTAAPTSPIPPCSLVMQSVSYVTGALMVISRACVDAVGPFDERLGSYAEDVDYCWRAADAGWGIVSVPGVTARCLGQVAADSTLLTQVNSVRLVRFRRGRTALAVRLLAELPFLIRNALGSVFSRNRPAHRRGVRIDVAVLSQMPLLWRSIADRPSSVNGS